MQKVEEEATKGAQDRQASLIKLAEQTVIEADKLADIIKDEAKREAEEEAAKIIADSKKSAQQYAQNLTKKAEKEATSKQSSILAKADQQAQEAITKARREAQVTIQTTAEKVANIESEAKLEAEYLVRRFAAKFVEEIRSAVTDTTNQLLPSMDALTREVGHNDISSNGSDLQPTATSNDSRAKHAPKA